MAQLYLASIYERLRNGLPLLAQGRRYSALRVLSLLLLVVAVASPLYAQQFATLNLTVSDQAASVVAQAKVSIRNVDTGVLRTGLSDRRGLVLIPGLPAGQYTLNVDAQSFSSYETPLTLTLGEVATLQITLHIQAATELIEVNDTEQGVDKESTEGSQVINPVQIADLPISDRDFINFCLLLLLQLDAIRAPLPSRLFRKRFSRSASGDCERRTACSMDWMELTTQRPSPESSELARRSIGFRSSVLWMARTQRAAA